MTLNRQRIFLAGLMVLWVALSGREAAQTPDMTIGPADPTIFVGQTQQFSADRPTVGAVSAGGEYTCVTLPDGSGQCTGRNQFNQHGNGGFTNSAVLDPISDLTAATRVVAGDEFAC